MLPDLARNLSLEGRIALVTGASGSLGGRFAQVLAGSGAAVVLAARRLDALQDLRDRLSAEGAVAHAVEMDVTSRDSVTAAVAQAEQMAAGPVDILINNSGIAQPGAALDQDDEDWARVFAVNVEGARRASVAVVRRLVQAGRPGAIVNVASILGLRQGAGVSAYATSKAALIQMTRQHALEWARHRIRVNALAPGYVETDLNRDFFAAEAGQAMIRRIPQRRLGQAGELDGPLLLLASGAGSFMTGSVIVADGGHLLSPL
ncbi:SDR family NAD(P)-dependent oxidoreductase [Paracoccus spongiarum]|uniref:SDR family NAD(P)-dependent oxidoreductase n=1 Tax=Paracoccus spongiarum TaxID=3064387 RepID=A0ABT9JCG8_9RHOB|nr:SDR family NAD(P)-dependent oxidoreductase [Paracoccus sp. 2205BS29-5]MDP5307415.1 SDR family NAD(P)-dependent oxidoreductase [Paracoccus sp. 2205BS29-5]